MPGRKYCVSCARASTCFAEHLVKDPTRYLELAIIKGYLHL
jgi:hypothetical protein